MVDQTQRDRPVIEVTPAMISAGRSVLLDALSLAEMPESWFVTEAAEAVYIAMDRARFAQTEPGRPHSEAWPVQGG